MINFILKKRQKINNKFYHKVIKNKDLIRNLLFHSNLPLDNNSKKNFKIVKIIQIK